ncbi:hypothetical protein IAQ61_010272 [Plenodomus lingam]|uniref:uncharacterized protein n=1 Tax=Leptosphaeria maculans TaxID=5022 RepID=UPI0033267F13|nr:hypothetical protein IAQ61_010272 [Plenodomus lingam]
MQGDHRQIRCHGQGGLFWCASSSQDKERLFLIETLCDCASHFQHPSSETSLVASAQSRNVVQEHCALFHHPVSYLHCGTAISEAHGNTCPNRSVFPKSVLLGQIKLLLTLWRDPIPGLPKAPPSCCKDDIQEAPKRNMMTNFSIVARSERCKPWNRLSVSMAHARPVAQRSGHFQLLCASIPESRPEYCT